MRKIPSDRWPDSTLALALEGYRFILNRCDRYETDIFQTRLLFEKVICFRGGAAAKVFYDTEKFSRKGAAPKRVQKTLTGEGGVQGLDGAVHRQRKQIFMSLMTPEHIAQLEDLTQQQWREYAQKWQQQDRVVLFDEAEELLCRAVCTWSGIPLSEAEVKQRTWALSTMISGSGRIGPKHWQARRARQQAERWMIDLLEKIRAGKMEVSANSAAYAFAWHRNSDGALLDKQIAAVDLLNVLRPTVAIGRYITFAALALHEHPDCHQQLKESGANYANLFTQEVRRFYPFFPFAAAQVRHEFEWQGYRFPQGTKVLLDLYGTNHAPDLWEQPEAFRPERFSEWQSNSFDFIPQGGGDHYANHRCAGEWITIQLVERALDFLVNAIEYQVPPQNLSFSLSKMPTVPNSRFVISRVRTV